MSLTFIVKKTTFGFDKEKTEKYVARPHNTNYVDFNKLCEQVSKIGFVPRGTVKSVLDGLIDSLITYMEFGATVSLGDFGSFRPTFGCKSQTDAKEVTADALRRRRILFTPGKRFKNMLKEVSIQRLGEAKLEGAVLPGSRADETGESKPQTPGENHGGSTGEAPDPAI